MYIACSFGYDSLADFGSGHNDSTLAVTQLLNLYNGADSQTVCSNLINKGLILNAYDSSERYKNDVFPFVRNNYRTLHTGE